MADRVDINMSSIRIAGVGGLGMLAMVAVVAYAMPEARLFVLLSYGAGTVGAFAFIAYRRWMKPERPHGPTLMIEPPGAAVPSVAERKQSAGDSDDAPGPLARLTSLPQPRMANQP